MTPKTCVLFDTSIYNNISFSNHEASSKQVFRAMKFAQLYKIVKNFPNKEKTIVGERGVKLSGGEKQHVSIARAILADKKILVLDEASIDNSRIFQLALTEVLVHMSTNANKRIIFQDHFSGNYTSEMLAVL